MTSNSPSSSRLVSIAGPREKLSASSSIHHGGSLLSEKRTTTRTRQQLGYAPVGAPSALRIERLGALSKSGTAPSYSTASLPAPIAEDGHALESYSPHAPHGLTYFVAHRY